MNTGRNCIILLSSSRTSTPVKPGCRIFRTGQPGPLVVDAYLNGPLPLPAQDCNLLAFVLNERPAEVHLPHLATYIR